MIFVTSTANFRRLRGRKKSSVSRVEIEMRFLIRHLFLIRFPQKYRSAKPISLRFTRRTREPRSASWNRIGKSRNSPFKRYEPAARRASDQRTITPKRIFTSGRMHATGYGAGEFTFSLAAHRIMAFLPFSSFFFRGGREQRAHAVSWFACIEA